MLDRYKREINYLRLSITDRCNYNCRYCKPENEDSLPTHNIMTDEEIIKVIKACSDLGVNKVRLTGGEPLMRKGIVELIKNIKNIHGINEVVMTTNGSLLLDHLEALKAAGLNRVNLSLDSLDPIKFKYITNGGKLNDVMKCIDQLLLLEMKPVKINVVLMRGFNDDEITDFINLTKHKDIIVRFIELMPIGNHEFSYESHFLSNQEVLNKFSHLIPLIDEFNETAKYYQLPNHIGKIGLISSISNHFCNECNRIRITADGKVKTCLHENKEYDLLGQLRKGDESIDDFIKLCILQKPKSHKMNHSDFKKVDRNMFRIGG